jgi:glucose/arabinose dehydrogenase
MDFSPTGELWVLEQAGRVKLVRNDATTHTALTLSIDSRGERGLLGIAFAPSYDGVGANPDHVYLYHTLPGGSNNRITRYEVTAAGTTTPTLVNPVTIFDLDALSGATNHNGGAIHFGPDGLLYVAVGDNANGANAQSLATLHGKMLRMNPDGTAPASNPFFIDDATVADRDFIWALGLRNPFTFSFQPGTGRMFINDVGQQTWEEINEGAAGRNFGWATTEGDFNQATYPNFTRPVYAYSHGGGSFQGYAITGGSFYNPTVASFPSQYVGDYFFADYGNSWINVRDSVTGAVTQFATGASNPVDLKVSPDGALYYLARGTGRIMRIRSTASLAPTITQDPEGLTGAEGESATFSVVASGTAPLSYRWQQFVGGAWTNLSDGGRIGGATTASLSISNLQGSDAGQYRAVVTNAAGSAASDPAELVVISAPGWTGLTATYFDNSNFTGTSITRIDPTVNLNPGRGSPASGIGADTFSVRWTGAIVPLFTQQYTFRTTSDDGVRLWVNDRLIINNWTRHAPTVNTGRINLEAGRAYSIRMDYFENTGGSIARLEWQAASQPRQVVPESQLRPTYAPPPPPPPPSNGLTATYFNNSDFTGTTYSRVDALVNFNWGSGSPHPTIAADTFSVRWTGSIEPLVTGSHTFFTTSDDGVRLWVNGQLVINNWTRHAPTVNSGRIDLVAGQRYDIRMEYFENSGGSIARLEWQADGLPRQIIPTSQLFPSAAQPLSTQRSRASQ